MSGIRGTGLAVVLSTVFASAAGLKAEEPQSGKTAVKKVSLLGWMFGAGDDAAANSTDTPYRQVKAIPVSSKTGNIVAIARGPEDTVLAVAGPARGGRGAAGVNAAAEIQMYSNEGKLLRKWEVGFAATAAATTPSGEIVVAGDGKIAKFDAQGKQLACIDAPHVARLLKDPAAIRKQAEERKASMVKMYQAQVDMLKKQVEAQKKREKDKEEGGVAASRSNLNQMVKMYEDEVAQLNKRSLESFVGEITGQIKTVNAVAASQKYVFLTCGESKGYGYNVWRMNADFSSPKSVMTGLSGCCGQMDVQCCEDCLLVAENTRKRVGVYSFDGKQIRTFGKDSRDSVAEGFGGCCNPMNSFPAEDGSVITAESEGFIKRFDRNGKFVELLAQAKLSGGCKNVAVASSKDGRRVYLMDLPGSKLLIFEKKTAATVAANQN